MEGGVQQISFSDAAQRLGGYIDLLKLDCEGGEWSLFEDFDTWRRVRYLTMEYHLWAKPGATIDSLVKILVSLGFDCDQIEPSANGAFGLLRASNRSLGQGI
jgi:hypothetical protein